MRITRERQSLQITIIRFCDGDTIVADVKCNHCQCSQERSIRIRGIESHEPYGVTKEVAQEVARRYTQEFQHVRAELILAQSGSDRYGRIIGHVFIHGKNLAELLVERGDAWYHNHNKQQ